MSKKNLRNLTIIPPELYIRRDADRQVSQIIDDMGRPGYVLVARQMGKTNLLLNIRRDFQSLKDAFVYIDVSNIFPTLRAFFRNIIDTAIGGLEHPIVTRSEILHQRDSTKSFPEHQEHESELAYLLSILPGKLVICLDEVDALSKTPFSDSVFSFIRSVYFSGRINVPSFSRLTYLLSGVAEPTELIKNKAISPFNIGAKIYLEDFSRQELGSLAAKLAAPVSDEVIDRVYFWTQGHPRLSWDLLSLLEDKAILNTSIIASDLDAIVSDSYLTHFDLPPIDNIRTLVQDDREIRDALMSIHYGRSESISTSLRTRLYLNGIIGSQQSAGQVTFKNNLIEAALSEEWLHTVDQEKRTTVERANAAYIRGDYSAAAGLYREYFTTVGGDANLLTIASRAGISLMRIGKFEEAIEYLRKDPVTYEDSIHGYALNHFFLGLCYRLVGKINLARHEFKEVIHCGDKGRIRPLYIQARIFLALMDIVDLPAKRDDIMESCDYVIRVLGEEVDIPDNGIDADISVTARYLQFQVHDFEGNNYDAEQALRSAITVASGNDRISLIIRLARYLADSGVAQEFFELEQAVDLIEASTPVLREQSAMNHLDLTEERVAGLLRMTMTFDVPLELSARLFKYLASKVISANQSRRVVLSTFYDCLGEITAQRLSDLLAIAARTFRSIETSSLQRKILLLLALSSANTFDQDLIDQLANSFKPENFSFKDEQAWFVLLSLKRIVEAGKIEGASTVAAFIRSSALSGRGQEDDSEVLDAWDIVSDHLLFLASISHAGSESIALATKNLAALRRFESTRGRTSLRREDLSSMTSSLHRFLQSIPQKTIRRTAPKIGRNDLVSIRLVSGEVQRGKYKRYEHLVLSGGAIIVQ